MEIPRGRREVGLRVRMETQQGRNWALHPFQTHGLILDGAILVLSRLSCNAFHVIKRLQFSGQEISDIALASLNRLFSSLLPSQEAQLIKGQK